MAPPEAWRALIARARRVAIAKLALAALVLSWLLTKTSASLAANLPLALLAVVTLRWMMAQVDAAQRMREAAREAQRWRRELRDEPPTTPAAAATAFGLPPGAARPEQWRKFVRSPVVEEAWARFCGSIVQEFIYDMWYGYLTPDREFPAEVRRLLNAAFGQLALRARRLDLRVVMNDLCELCMEQLELYRDTRESILLATQQPHVLRDMAPAARDRALRTEMRAERNLHPALQAPEGHYKFLRAVSEGVVAYLLDVEDLKRPVARSVCRELLAACVLRPLMQWATPYYANKALYAALREQAPTQRRAADEAAQELSVELARSRSEAMRGHWEFEQRMLSSVEGEAVALAAARQLRHQLRSKLSQHSRSRSADMLAEGKDSQQQQQQQEQGRQQAGAAATVSASQQQQQAHLHMRARSCSPAELAGLSAERSAAGGAAAQAPTNSAGSSSSLRGRSGILRPPRPPPLQPPDGASPFESVRGAAQQEGEVTPRLVAGSGWRLASSSGQAQQQQQRRPASPPARQPAESQESCVTLGEGWEAVDAAEASDASLTLPRRDFSTAHLLAPQLDPRMVEGVAPRATSSSSAASVGGGEAAAAGFVGAARAKVVAADLNTSGSKDYVEFKIRVADDGGEWTVSRRYRHFEVLHRQLRALPAYRLRLPPKRIFVHTNNVEFVEERREALDRYLQALLAHEQLRHCSDLYEFLRAGSQLYELASPLQPPPRRAPSSVAGLQQAQQLSQQQRGRMLGGLSRAVLDTSHSVGRGLSSATHGVTGLATAAGEGVVGLAAAAGEGMAKAASGVVGVLAGRDEQDAADAEQRSGLARRVRSVPVALDRADSESSGELLAAQRPNSGSALLRDGSSGGLLSKASIRLRQAMHREGSASAPVQQLLEPSGHSSSSSAGSEAVSAPPSTRVSQQQPGPGILPPPYSSGGSLSSSPSRLGVSPSKKASKIFSSLRRRSRSISPQKPAREAKPGRALSPSRRRRGTGEPGSAAGSRRNSSDGLEGGPSPGVPPHLASSLGPPSPTPASPIYSFPLPPSLDPDDCAGISSPLYEMVDCLFQLQTRGFFRRQVFGVARQALSLVAGEAIDGWLVSHLSRLREEHTIGRIIQRIQAGLWPGGLWFQRTPAAQAAAAAAAAAKAAQQGSTAGGGGQGGYVRPAGMEAASFLEPSGLPPLDGEEIREAVEQLLLRRAPSALVRLIGKNAYASGMRDLFEMLQSPTFSSQLGYGVLEIALVHLLPELKPLFRTLQHGGLDV